MMRLMRGYLDGVRFFLNERSRSMQYLRDLLRTKDDDMIELSYDKHPQHAMGRKPYPDHGCCEGDYRRHEHTRAGG